MIVQNKFRWKIEPCMYFRTKQIRFYFGYVIGTLLTGYMI